MPNLLRPMVENWRHISLEIESGKSCGYSYWGEYLAQERSQQEKTTATVYRMENQIYIDNTTYVNLFE